MWSIFWTNVQNLVLTQFLGTIFLTSNLEWSGTKLPFTDLGLNSDILDKNAQKLDWSEVKQLWVMEGDQGTGRLYSAHNLPVPNIMCLTFTLGLLWHFTYKLLFSDLKLWCQVLCQLSPTLWFLFVPWGHCFSYLLFLLYSWQNIHPW